jgi:hypothetical protein
MFRYMFALKFERIDSVTQEQINKSLIEKIGETSKKYN